MGLFNIFKSKSNGASEIDRTMNELQSLLKNNDVREALIQSEALGNVGIGQITYIKQVNDLVLKLTKLTGKTPEQIFSDPTNLRPQKVETISFEDAEWLDKLISWADRNNLPELKVEEHMIIAGGYHEGIPRNKHSLLNLQTLNLKDCNLTELPKEIGKLHSLKKLWLEGNNLRYLPNEVCNLVSLQELYVPNNRIEHLPENIGNLRNLVEINFSKNYLERLPFSMVLLHRLKKIDFRSQKNDTKISPPVIGSLICDGSLDDDDVFRTNISMSDENSWNDLKTKLRNTRMRDIKVNFNGRETPFLKIIEELYGREIADAQRSSNFYEIAKC
jgi:hypothetical protein